MDRRLTSVEKGTKVFGSDRKPIGAIRECTDFYCEIDTGVLGLGHRYFVPADAIINLNATGVFIDARGSELDRMGWDGRPTGAAGRAREYEGAPEEEPTPRQEGTRTMELEEEEIRVRKQRETAGEVDISKEVVEERRTLEVPVSHEEVVIRQRFVDRGGERPLGRGETIRIPLSEEHVTSEKETHVYSEIEVEKYSVTEQKEISETVRKEVPKVQKKGHIDNYVQQESSDLTEMPRREDKAA